MSATTYREACGTHLGSRLHQEHDEPPCDTCATAETWRHLYAETFPQRPPPRRDPLLEPVTPEQAFAHRSELLAALDTPNLRAVGGAA